MKSSSGCTYTRIRKLHSWRERPFPQTMWSFHKRIKGKLAVTDHLFEEEQICILFLYANWDAKH
jgi:hypothetical protein